MDNLKAEPTVDLNEPSELDATPDNLYDREAERDRDSRDLRERDRDARDVRERDHSSSSAPRNGYASPVKAEASDLATSGEKYSSSRRSPRPDKYGSGRTRTPYERPSGDSRGGPSKYSAGPRDPSRPSKKECRVYVGNLAYEVGWQDLKDFMRAAGEVVFADILTLPEGRSKGCGVVEFTTPEEAQKAIRDLSETQLMNRPVFIREDREQEAKFGSSRRVDTPGRALFVGNLPYVVAWQDLKDHFRQAGHVVRADVAEGPDRRSRGMGTVVFETAEQAGNAISMFDGTEWHGRRLEVREDRGGPPMGRGPPPRSSYGGQRGYDRPHRGYDSRDYYGGGGGGGGYDSYGGPPPRDYYGGGSSGGGYDNYGGGYGGYGSGGGGGYGYDRGYGGAPDYGHPGGAAPPPHRNDYYKDYPPPPPPAPGTGGYAADARGGYGDRGSYGDARGAPGGYVDRYDQSRTAPYGGEYHR
ncbi:hypothetical protein PhCBS80983_g04698 [Powellomyces hirtus]|uniref:RRM domain-containing protein n=1 Tax=Powellomyces hirtus TaxID=109895 RepID=A0A507DZ49_9FUNG|nr:hypothetical protein PhCBS80983_g04698 [Powellomyces hirtus]